jgi:CheY-like chemotaxis protein
VKHKEIVILVAEDDDEDFFLTQKALSKGNRKNSIHRVKNGQELLEYLLPSQGFSDPMENPTPTLILLDLNMPIMDGRTALKKIKNHPNLKTIPIIVLTTSQAEEDIIKTYALGVNSFIRKPVDFSQFVDVMKSIQEYWFQIVELPK